MLQATQSVWAEDKTDRTEHARVNKTKTITRKAERYIVNITKYYTQIRPIRSNVISSGGSKNFEKETEDNLSAPSSFIANAHNEIYAFLYGKKRLFWQKYEPIGFGCPHRPPWIHHWSLGLSVYNAGVPLYQKNAYKKFKHRPKNRHDQFQQKFGQMSPQMYSRSTFRNLLKVTRPYILHDGDLRPIKLKLKSFKFSRRNAVSFIFTDVISYNHSSTQQWCELLWLPLSHFPFILVTVNSVGLFCVAAVTVSL